MKSVLMLAAHEPTLDPRIDWEARFASGEFHVEVLGLHGHARPCSDEEEHHGYRIRRLKLYRGSTYVAAFFAHIFSVLPRSLQIFWACLAVFSFPILMVIEVIVRLSHWAASSAYSLMSRLMTVHLLISVIKKLLPWRFRTTPTGGQLRAFLSVLTDHYAPVTAQFWLDVQSAQVKPDIVHCNDLDTLLVGIKAKRAFGCKVVYDAHEYWPHSNPEAAWYQVTFFKAYERLLVKRCDHVVTVNPMLADEMSRAYGLGVVLSLPNVEPWKPDRKMNAYAGPISKIASGRVKFLYQGNFAAQRGIEELLTAWSVLCDRNASLFLRGPENKWKRECRDLARRLRVLDSSVYFLDPVGEDELITAAMEADVGLIPYRPIIAGYKYCCPNKLSQYMQAGLMVISNDLPYVKQVLTQSKAGLSYDSSLPETIVQVLHRATDDESLRTACKTNALTFSRDGFNWQAHYPVLRSAYHF